MSTIDNVGRNIRRILEIPPRYTTIRINSMKASNEEVITKCQLYLDKEFEKRGCDVPIVERHPFLEDMLFVKSQGPIPRTQRQLPVIVNAICGSALLRGAHVFTAGVLGSHPHLNAGDMVSVYADLDGRCLMGTNQPYKGRTLHVGNGRAIYGRKEIFNSPVKPSGIAVEMLEPIYAAPSLSGLLPDLIFPQNLPSVTVGHVLNPQPGELILDMCAAPGGKTTHLATLMKNQGRVVALDKSAARVEKIKENCAAWELSIVESYAFDAARCIQDGAALTGPPPYPPEVFDRVLLDGPCSALGQRPVLEAKQLSTKQLASHPKQQRSILAEAVRALRPGGVLVYSTCTLPTSENEDIVAWALRKFPQLELTPQNPVLGGPGLSVQGLTEEQTGLLQRFGPARLVSASMTEEDLQNIFANPCHSQTHTHSNSQAEECDSGASENTSELSDSKSRHNSCNEYNCEEVNCLSETLLGDTVEADTIGFFIAKFTKR